MSGDRIFVREHGVVTRLCTLRFNSKPGEGDIIRDYDKEVLIEIQNGNEVVIMGNYRRPVKIVPLKTTKRKSSV